MISPRVAIACGLACVLAASSAIATLPFAEPATLDLDDYTTKKTLDGLFTLLADEERKIRTDPAKRTTSLLRRVFGI